MRDFPDADRIALHTLELHSRADSRLDGATKLLFKTREDLLLESVILRSATGRTTLCVSSQVGCAAACEFCATGRMGFAKNLTAEELLDQVLQAGQLVAQEKRFIRNIVLMGMGEPFHNERHLHAALEALIAPVFFHHSPTKILISTVGIPDAMLRCVGKFPSIRLALSLHSVRQEFRERLIPLARKYHLDELREAIVQINRLSRYPVMLEYLMLAGLNDSLDDAQDLAAWSQGLNVHINLIPFNAIEGAPDLRGSEQTQRESFANLLKRSGFKTTIRYSLGSDILAACGQLARREQPTQTAAR